MAYTRWYESEGKSLRCCISPIEPQKMDLRGRVLKRLRNRANRPVGTMIGSGSALQVLPEKVQCYRPGLLGGIGVIALRIVVGMKSVPSPGIDFINVGFVVSLRRLFGACNALVHGWIPFSIVRQHRCLNVFHQVERLRTAAIENHGSLEPANLCRRRKCHLAAPAKTDEPNAISPYIRKSSKKDKD